MPPMKLRRGENSLDSTLLRIVQPLAKRLPLAVLVALALTACAVEARARKYEPTQTWTQYGGANRDFSAQPAPLGTGKPVGEIWRRKLGQGASGVVSDGKRLYTLYSEPDPVAVGTQIEVVVALDKATGRTVWESRHPIKMLKGQESYTGDPPRPQATPALLSGRLCALGFTGLLQCFNAASGRIAWERNLVSEFEATPVQFGFSSSPLVYQDKFIVHVGGKQTSLVAFSALTGRIAWRSAPAEPSYASPALIKVAGEMQVVQITRDAIQGVSAQNGAVLWTRPTPALGLTNVPTPIALPGGRLLISGQGVLGTRLLQLSGKGEEAKAEEVWKNTRNVFFYCNWAADSDAVYGSIGNFAVALSLATGEELWKERGQSDANLLKIGGNALLLRGDGLLTLCQLSPKGLKALSSFRLLSGRCWAAPTLLGGVLYARDDREITAVGTDALTPKP